MERISYDDPRFRDLTTLHILRYLLASQFVEGKSVLDVGCGEGFGARLLLGRANNVVGCDISTTAIHTGKSKSNRGCLDLLVCEGTKLPFQKGRFDVVLILEVIEHLKNPRTILDETKKVLNKDGVCIISTPRRILRGLPLNPYHFEEFSFKEFRALLSYSFESIEIVGQKILDPRWKFIHKTSPLIPAGIRQIVRRIFLRSKTAPNSQSVISSDYPNVTFVTGTISQKSEYLIAICKHPIIVD